jgi:hypothetical protein
MRDVDEWSPTCRPPHGLVRPVPLDPLGVNGPTRGQARSRRWRQSSRGLYVPAHVDAAVPEQRVLELSALLPPHGAVTGWAALRWHGAGYFDGLEPDGHTVIPVPLAVGPSSDLRDRPGITVMRDRLDGSEITRLRDLPCTSVERALFDDMRTQRGVRAATVSMDMVAAAELSTVSRMRRYCESRRGWRGRPQVLAALELADEDSMSPNETRMRLAWELDAELPRPMVNKPVFDLRGRLLGTTDLFDPETGLVGEYDGAAHRAARRHRKDVAREERFRRAGLEYFKVVTGDLDDTDLLVDRMTSTRQRAHWLPPSQRAWTTTQPEGWYDSPIDAASLDERLDYREWLRERSADF